MQHVLDLVEAVTSDKRVRRAVYGLDLDWLIDTRHDSIVRDPAARLRSYELLVEAFETTP